MPVKFKTQCYNCSGSGVVSTTGLDCMVCGAGGFVDCMYMADPIADTIASIYPTYLIMEATDASEFNALSDNNKDAYRQIISCGNADLGAGTAAHTKLLNMFDAQSTTRANLITLLGQ